MRDNFDVVIIGGGVVGSSLAAGLIDICPSRNILMITGGRDNFQASRSNFGLVWQQGKGSDCIDYAKITALSAQQWQDFAHKITSFTRLETDYEKKAGFTFFYDKQEKDAYAKKLARLRNCLPNLTCKILSQRELQKTFSQGQLTIGEHITGALYSPLEAHINPLKLLRALYKYFQKKNGTIFSGSDIDTIVPKKNYFDIHAKQVKHKIRARKLVLAAGLGNQQLGEFVGLKQPLSPNKGQILVSQRIGKISDDISLHMRQGAEGSLFFGASEEDSGYDDSSTIRTMAKIAKRAVCTFPDLKDLLILRGWGGLRIKTQDGLPLYDQSEKYPNAFAFSCHSAITLGAFHSNEVAKWIAKGKIPKKYAHFSVNRFQRPSHA